MIYFESATNPYDRDHTKKKLSKENKMEMPRIGPTIFICLFRPITTMATYSRIIAFGQ